MSHIVSKLHLLRQQSIRKQIKRRLESDPLLNIAAAHVVVTPAINYGNDDDEAAGSSGTAVSQTPNRRRQRKLTDLWSTPASDQGYGSMLVTPTPIPAPQPRSGESH